MTTRTNLATKSREWGLVITRTINAPRELVYKAWIDQKLMAKWWGPNGFTNPVCELDVRPGGAIRIDMRGPDGTVYPMKGVFREIKQPERLVFTSNALEDEKGDPQLENLNTIALVGLGKKTKITVQVDVVKSMPAAEKALSGMEEGWKQSLDRLEKLLAKN
jgi:uncharacterized protein YndB with AHSA1/START domain